MTINFLISVKKIPLKKCLPAPQMTSLHQTK